MDYGKRALEEHKKYRGKIEIKGKVNVNSRDDLSTYYTPGVAKPCLEIARDESLAYEYTNKGNMVAVVSDGSAVLGLGNIGGSASIPVMEGKALLFKEFGNIDAFPICLNTQDVDEIVKTVKYLEPVFGGINIEDIKAPNCFIIEERLKKELSIPVFHDDQHGTAIVVLAGVINALKLANKKLEDAEIVINGAGSAGIAICKLLLQMNVKNIVMCDIHGILHEDQDIDFAKKEIARVTNKNNENGLLVDAIKNKDVFIGVSAPNIVTSEMISSMNDKSIVFAMANPTPEIMPDEAKKGGAFIIGTGRSDFPNQVNNVLAFPSIFRGALDARAKEITEEMKIAAALAIADSVTDLRVDNIMPSVLDKTIAKEVAKKVYETAIKEKNL